MTLLKISNVIGKENNLISKRDQFDYAGMYYVFNVMLVWYGFKLSLDKFKGPRSSSTNPILQ